MTRRFGVRRLLSAIGLFCCLIAISFPPQQSLGAVPPTAAPREKPAGEKPPGDNPAADKPVGDKPAGEKAAKDKRPGDKRPGDKPAPPKPQKDEEYYELFKLFADTFDQVERNYVKEVDRRRLVDAAIRGMIAELDPYSDYVPPAQLARFKAGVETEFGGIGIQVGVDNGHLRVLSPLLGTPAYRHGILAGDVILEIDGRSTTGITIDEAVRRLQGKEGTEVTLTIVHADSTKRESVKLRREVIRVETVLGDSRKADNSWKWMYDDERRIGYVRLTGFGKRTAAALRSALEELTQQKMRGLVLDLRFNPGGLLSSAIEVSDLFVAKGRIVSTEGRNTPSRVWEAHEKGTFSGFAMAVLVNRYSASASEIVAACLQDHHRAVVVGERTWGKGSVQNVVELENGNSALKLTTAGYRRPNGKNIHRFKESTEKDDWGVSPDEGCAVKLSPAEMQQWVANRREKDVVRTKPDPKAKEPRPSASAVDPQLQKALDCLHKQLDSQKPPADKPPADKPPADKPPADKPPADKPPADKPPADKPPADKPPAKAGG
jgi:carboxyl-terminal processing protease